MKLEIDMHAHDNMSINPAEIQYLFLWAHVMELFAQYKKFPDCSFI